MDIAYGLFETPLGWMGAAASPKGLRYLALPKPSPQEVEAAILRRYPQAFHSDETFRDLALRINRYLEGENTPFTDKLDWSGATPFQQAAWKAAMSIPYGQTRSYSWLAQQTGRPRAQRAAGQAMAANPIAIIVPCHRVIASGGGLGGFGGRLDLKRSLLRLENPAIP